RFWRRDAGGAAGDYRGRVLRTAARPCHGRRDVILFGGADRGTADRPDPRRALRLAQPISGAGCGERPGVVAGGARSTSSPWASDTRAKQPRRFMGNVGAP